MKKLLFVIKRITQTELANRLNIGKANITAWKIAKRIPKNRIAEIEAIHQELKDAPRIKK